MIAYVEEVIEPKGRWLGIELDPEDQFRKRQFWGQKSADEILQRLDPSTEILTKQEFYLRAWRVFFLPRTNDPEASWEVLVDLAGWDPTSHRPRIRVNQSTSTPHKRNKSRLDHAMERNARHRSGQPVASSAYSPPRTRTTKVPLSQVKTYTLKEDGSTWISPVNYAKVIGLPPQYVYQAISKGKLRTKEGPKSKLIRLEDADRYYRRKEDDVPEPVRPTEGGPPEGGGQEAGGHDSDVATVQMVTPEREGQSPDGGSQGVGETAGREVTEDVDSGTAGTEAQAEPGEPGADPGRTGDPEAGERA